MFPRDLCCLRYWYRSSRLPGRWETERGAKIPKKTTTTTTSMLPRTAVHFVIRYETILLSHCTYGIVWYIQIYIILYYCINATKKLLLMCAAIILVRDSKREREREWERQTATMYIKATICVRVKKAVLSSYRTLCECVCCQSSLLRIKYDKQWYPMSAWSYRWRGEICRNGKSKPYDSVRCLRGRQKEKGEGKKKKKKKIV